MEPSRFITVNLGNVCKANDVTCNGGFCFDNTNNRIDCDFNFNIAYTSATYGTYDFDSVMHYSSNAFSRNGSDTITVLPPNDIQWQSLIGQRTRLSLRDQNIMGCLYPRSEWRWIATWGGGFHAAGDCFSPYRTIYEGVNKTPSDGTLWIEPGYYAEADLYTIYNTAMTLKAPNGTVTIGP